MANKSHLLQRLERLETNLLRFQQITKEQMFAALYDPMHEDYQ